MEVFSLPAEELEGEAEEERAEVYAKKNMILCRSPADGVER